MRLAYHGFTGWRQLGAVKAIVVALAPPSAYGVRQRLGAPRPPSATGQLGRSRYLKVSASPRTPS